MKLWVDDMRPAPKGYIPAFSVNQAKRIIFDYECYSSGALDELDFDWLEETGRNYPIRIHSMNTVGRQNMRLIIEKNGWKEIR